MATAKNKQIVPSGGSAFMTQVWKVDNNTMNSYL